MTTRLTFLTYAYDDPDGAPVLNVADTLDEARQRIPTGVTYQYRVVDRGPLLDETYLERRVDGVVQ